MKQKLTARAGGNRGAESTGACSVPGARRPRHTLTWCPRFLLTRAAHFPPPQDNAPPTALGGTTVMEDSKAAVLGMPATLGPETHPNRLQVMPELNPPWQQPRSHLVALLPSR